jgi:hypothetical protein
MNKILLFLFIFFSVDTFAQAKKIKVKKEKEKSSKYDGPTTHGTLDLYYGNRVFAKNYYGQLNTADSMNLNGRPKIAGFGYSGYRYSVGRGRSIGLYSQMNYYKIIPENIMIEDSLSTKLSGFVYGLGFGTGLYSADRKLSITAYLGFNTGRTTLSKNKFITQKNQFFSPKVMIQPKVIIKKLVISLIVEAEYDVSNPMWKQTRFERKDPYLLIPFHQTCFTGLVSLGWWLR